MRILNIDNIQLRVVLSSFQMSQCSGCGKKIMNIFTWTIMCMVHTNEMYFRYHVTGNAMKVIYL